MSRHSEIDPSCLMSALCGRWWFKGAVTNSRHDDKEISRSLWRSEFPQPTALVQRLLKLTNHGFLDAQLQIIDYWSVVHCDVHLLPMGVMGVIWQRPQVLREGPYQMGADTSGIQSAAGYPGGATTAPLT